MHGPTYLWSVLFIFSKYFIVNIEIFISEAYLKVNTMINASGYMHKIFNQTLHYSDECNNFVICHHKQSFTLQWPYFFPKIQGVLQIFHTTFKSMLTNVFNYYLLCNFFSALTVDILNLCHRTRLQSNFLYLWQSILCFENSCCVYSVLLILHFEWYLWCF